MYKQHTSINCLVENCVKSQDKVTFKVWTSDASFQSATSVLRKWHLLLFPNAPHSPSTHPPKQPRRRVVLSLKNPMKERRQLFRKGHWVFDRTLLSRERLAVRRAGCVRHSERRWNPDVQIKSKVCCFFLKTIPLRSLVGEPGALRWAISAGAGEQCFWLTDSIFEFLSEKLKKKKKTLTEKDIKLSLLGKNKYSIIDIKYFSWFLKFSSSSRWTNRVIKESL